MFFRLRQWLRDLRHPRVVIISHSGQLTPRPQAHVSVARAGSSQGVYTWDLADAGDAKATYYGKGLAEIMQCRLVDERT